nr:unnamed protein product [Callosobruchus chinensis]
MKCRSVSDEGRIKIFNYFWPLSWPEKKLYIRDVAKLEKLKRRRGAEENSRREYTIKYFLKLRNEYLRVCKKMFLGTLGMKETAVLKWLKDSLDIEDNPVENKSLRISEVRKQRFKESQSSLLEFLNSLPKMDSHYCRSSTSKKYLKPIWKTKSELYSFYKKDFCAERSLSPVFVTTFFKCYEDLKLSIYQHKKIFV